MPKKKYKVKLTEKQRIFINEVLDGKTKTDAYKKAYNTKNMKPETIRSSASKLFKDELIQNEYLRLIQEAEEGIYNKYTTKYILKLLDNTIEIATKDIEKRGLNKTNSDTLLKAIDKVSNIKIVSEIDKKKLDIETARLMLEVEKAKPTTQANPLGDIAKKMEERRKIESRK